ncbi:hypothetical protein BGZ65_012681, partial [Modicella reniformis]
MAHYNTTAATGSTTPTPITLAGEPLCYRSLSAPSLLHLPDIHQNIYVPSQSACHPNQALFLIGMAGRLTTTTTTTTTTTAAPAISTAASTVGEFVSDFLRTGTTI